MKQDFEVVDYDIGKDDYRNVSNYDEKRYAGSVNEYKKTVTGNAYRRLIGSLEGKRILDVGCGTGRGVADFVGSAQMTIGADASQDMLRSAAKKVGRRSNVGLVCSYAQSLPFPTGYFDVVTSLNFVHLVVMPCDMRAGNAFLTVRHEYVHPGRATSRIPNPLLVAFRRDDSLREYRESSP